MEVKLVMFRQDGARKDFTIQNKNTVLGRGEECGLRIPLLAVSRKHCEIIKNDSQLKLRDLGSSNGTYVNSKRVTETALKPGDRLVIGPVIFTVQIDGKPIDIKPAKVQVSKAKAKANDDSGEEIALTDAPGQSPDTDEIIDLEADIALEGENDASGDADPLAALEELALEPDDEESNKENLKKKNKK